MAIKESELVLAPNGSLYHINLTGETLADNVLLVGDPDRVNMFKDIFESVEYESQNRELHALTGRYHGVRFTALSTGMGCDNIDIVATELDAAANFNLQSRTPRKEHRTLNWVRIGTCGSLQADVDCGSLVASRYAIGMDGLMNYYQHGDEGFEHAMEEAFSQHMQLDPKLAKPYCVRGSEMLLNKIGEGIHHGITGTAGFCQFCARKAACKCKNKHGNENEHNFTGVTLFLFRCRRRGLPALRGVYTRCRSDRCRAAMRCGVRGRRADRAIARFTVNRRLRLALPVGIRRTLYRRYRNFRLLLCLKPVGMFLRGGVFIGSRACRLRALVHLRLCILIL